MRTISIIYFSGSGHTTKLAEAIEKGAASVTGTKTNFISIDGNDIVNGRYQNDKVMAILDESDAIIFGSPTFMAGVAAQFKAFADATVGSWAQQKWLNKLAAGFTVSGALSGDKFNTLQYLQAFAMQHGMLWISLGESPAQPNGVNRLGSWSGVMAIAEVGVSVDISPNEEDKLTGEILGKRVAVLASRFEK